LTSEWNRSELAKVFNFKREYSRGDGDINAIKWQ
jgi:hypothetical protein